MKNRTGSWVEPATSFPWWLVGGLTLSCAAAAFLPGEKPNAVLGRWSYFQFYLLVTLLLATAVVAILFLLPAPHRRYFGFRLAAVGSSFFLVLLSLEAVAWLLPVRAQMDNPWYLLPGLGGVSPADGLPYGRPAHLFWTGSSRGDLALLNDDDDPHARPVTFQTDRDGFRNSQDLAQADLVTIGDSFTEAGNLPEVETYPVRLGQKLGVSVRNLGRSGYSTPTEFIVLKNYGLACRPKIVVWQIAESNDLADIVDYEAWVRLGRPNYFDFSARQKPTRSQAWRRRSLTYQGFDRLRHHDLNPWPFTGFFPVAPDREEMIRFLSSPGLGEPALGHPAWNGFTSPLAEAAALCRSNHIHLLVVHLPDKFRVLGPHTRLAPEIAKASQQLAGLPREVSLGVQLQEFCAAQQIPYLDATEALQQSAATGKLVYQPFDTHLSPLGHEIVADLIAKEIARPKK
jgi:hypothetical protein